MKIVLDKQEKYVIMSLEEDNLNSIIAPDIKSEFIFLRNEGVNSLILDLSKVIYVDSSGLSAILTANRLWKDAGLFILTGVIHPAVIKLIEISRLGSILTIIPTNAEAVDYILMASIEEELNQEVDSTNE